MQITYITAGIMSLVLALLITLSAVAQSAATSPSPQAVSSQTAPAQSEPQTTPAQPAQAEAPQSAPAQASPNAQTNAGQGRAQSQGQADEDNPLNLTEEQKTKLRPIIANENQQMEALRNDSSLTTDQKIAKANQIREAASPKIKAILTPDQLQKLAELQAKAQQDREGQGQSPSDSQKPQK